MTEGELALRDEIRRVADAWGFGSQSLLGYATRAAKAVRAEERERCAKVAEDMPHAKDCPCDSCITARMIAAEIREGKR